MADIPITPQPSWHEGLRRYAEGLDDGGACARAAIAAPGGDPPAVASLALAWYSDGNRDGGEVARRALAGKAPR